MKKIYSILCMLLLCSTVSFAEDEKVEIASSITNGAVSYTIDGSTVTLTATPSDGYYLVGINAAKTMNVSNIASTRTEGPAMGTYKLTRTSESNDLSATATYTFSLDGNLGAYVTAEFAVRTEITADKLSLSATSYVYNRTPLVPSIKVGNLISGTDYTVSYSKESPVDAGSYTLTVNGISRYKGLLTATWNINKKDVAIAAEDKTKVYGAADPELTYTVEGLVDGDELTGALVREEGENVGEYAITQGSLKASDNYNVTFTPAKFAITAATIDMTVSSYTGTYDGKSHSIVVTVADDVTVKYGTAENTYNLNETPTYINAGDYTIYYQVEKANYTTVTGSAKVTINKKDVAIAAEDKAKVYGAADPELTYTVEGLVDGDELTGALVREEGENVGEYAITQGSLKASDNYNVTFTPAKFAITAATIDMTVSSYTGTYDGKSHSIVVTVADDVTVKYGIAENTYNLNEAPTYINAGDYTIYYQVEKANYTTVTGSAKVTINKKDVAIAAEDKAKVYGAADPELTYTVEGLVDGDELTGALVREEGENVGEYAITQGNLKASDNYNVTFTPAKFAITAATIDMTVSSYTGTYDGKSHSIVVTVADDVTVKYGTAENIYNLNEAPTYINAGDYTIYYQVEKANYTTVTGSAKVSINKKDIVITAHDKTKVAGEHDPELTYSVEGLVEGDEINGALARAEGEAAGEYAITQGSLTASDNYNVSFTGAILTITAAEKPAEPNGNVVNTDNSVTEDGENFYQLNEDTKGAIKDHVNTEVALSLEASKSLDVDQDGNMNFKQGENADIMLPNQKAGDAVTLNFQGSVVGNSNDLELVNNPAGTRSTRAGSEMVLISGAEYRVLHDGNIVLTVVLTEAPVTISGINVSSSSSTGINLAPTCSQEDGTWHDLNGRKFYSKPAKKGVYIHQGVKVVVK